MLQLILIESWNRPQGLTEVALEIQRPEIEIMETHNL